MTYQEKELETIEYDKDFSPSVKFWDGGGHSTKTLNIPWHTFCEIKALIIRDTKNIPE